MRTIISVLRVALNAPEDAGAGDIELPAFHYDCLVQRLVMPFIVFPKMDTQRFYFRPASSPCLLPPFCLL